MPVTPNISPIDVYTGAHYGLGLIYGTTRAPWYVPLLFASGFELIERYAKAAEPKVFPVWTQDSLANSLMDIVAVMLGWATSKNAINYLIYRRKRRAS